MPIDRMRLFIRNLSAPAEFCLLVLVCFWWGIIGSAKQLVSHLTHTAQPEQITNSVVFWVVLMQLLMMAFAFWVGRIRGWSVASFGSRLSWKGTGAGVLLFILTALAILCCIVLTNVIAPGARNPRPVVSG